MGKDYFFACWAICNWWFDLIVWMEYLKNTFEMWRPSATPIQATVDLTGSDLPKFLCITC